MQIFLYNEGGILLKRTMFIFGSVLLAIAVIVIVIVFIPNKSTKYTAFNELVTELKNRGYTIEINDNENSMLPGAESKVLAIHQNEVISVFIYENRELMEKNSEDVSNNSGFYGWISEPHFYKKENIIVLYVGENVEIVNNLNQIIGVQIVGYLE